MKGLGETVRALRVRAGCSSARAFHRAWHRRGGACSYKAYCEIETGRLVPSPPLAARLASALSVRPGARQAEAFRSAYLFSATRNRSLARTLLQSLRPEQGSASIAERVLSIGMTRKRHVLTAQQTSLLVKHPETRLSLIALHTSSRPWTPSALASALGMSASDSHAALRRLAAAGLARERRGVYVCPQGNSTLVFPRPTRGELDKMGRSFFRGFPSLKGFPSGSWSRQYVVLFRARYDRAGRLARRAESLVSSVNALHQRSGEGSIFSIGAFVWKVS